MSPTRALAVFVAMFVTDYVWGRYMRHVADGRRMYASLYAVAVFLSSALVTIQFVGDHGLLVPAAFGAFAGTYVSVRGAA